MILKNINHDFEQILKGNYDPFYNVNFKAVEAYIADLQQTFALTKIILTKLSAIKQCTGGHGSLYNDLIKTITFHKVKRTYLCTNDIVISSGETVASSASSRENIK